MIIYLCLRLCCTVSSQHIPSKWVPTSVESSGLLPKHSIPFKVYPKYSNHLVNVHSHPTASMYPSLSSIDTNYANYARFPMQTEPIAASHIHNPINLLQPLSPNHSPQHFVPVHGSTSSGRGTRPYVSPVNIHDPNQPIPSVDILRPTAFASSGSFDSYPSPGTTQTAENTSVAGSSCSITYEGLKLDCYVASALYQDKLAQLKHRGMLSNEYATDQFNACDLEVGSDDATVGKARKRRSYTYTILKANSTRASAVKTGPSDIGNGTLVAMHSHAYPQEYPVMYTASPMHSTATRQRTSREELPETNETSSQACFLNAGLTVRKPYHMYNTYGQVRFIVQEEQLQLTQCQPKAICWSVKIDEQKKMKQKKKLFFFPFLTAQVCQQRTDSFEK